MQESIVIVSPSVILKHSCLSRCDLCSLVFKTSQGLQGHRISKQHLKKEMNLASQPPAPGTLQALLLEEVLEPWQKNVLAGTDLLVLMDNLRIQKNGEYIRKLQSLGAEALFGPPGKTEAWQPIDAGHLGAMIKDIPKEKFNQYLDHNDIMTGECRWETCN